MRLSPAAIWRATSTLMREANNFSSSRTPKLITRLKSANRNGAKKGYERVVQRLRHVNRKWRTEFTSNSFRSGSQQSKRVEGRTFVTLPASPNRDGEVTFGCEPGPLGTIVRINMRWPPSRSRRSSSAKDQFGECVAFQAPW